MRKMLRAFESIGIGTRLRGKKGSRAKTPVYKKRAKVGECVMARLGFTDWRSMDLWTGVHVRIEKHLFMMRMWNHLQPPYRQYNAVYTRIRDC